jgi:hypothetical protein
MFPGTARSSKKTYKNGGNSMRSLLCQIRTALSIGMFLLTACFGTQLFAQSAAVSGQVLDPSGAAVKGASVTLVRPATKLQTKSVSDARGIFILPPVVPGTYEITVTAPGFAVWKDIGITLEVGEQKHVSVVLPVGSVSQSVSVKDIAPEINTEVSDRGTVAESTLVENIPLDVRDPYQLTTFTPGVNQSSSMTAGTNYSSQSTTNTFYINGTKSGESDILIDGATNTVFYDVHAAGNVPGLDAIREFKIYTEAYSPEFGHTGGGIASYSLKSGTNRLHFGAWEYFRNDKMDGAIYKQIGPNPVFGRNQFGANVAGPLVIPHVYNGRNRTFFFGNYEEMLDSQPNNNGSGTTTTVPTALELAGDFSQTLNTNGKLNTIYDPSTTTNLAAGASMTCSNGSIVKNSTTKPGYYRCQAYNPTYNGGTSNVLNPANTPFNSIGQNLLGMYPVAPNQAGVGGSDENNYFSTAPDLHHDYVTDIRIDHKFNDKHSIFAHYDDFESYILYGAVFGQTSLTNNYANNHLPDKNILVDHTWILTNDLIFDHHLSWAHMESTRASLNPLGTAKFGIPASVAPGQTATFTPEVVGISTSTSQTNQIGSIGNLEPLEENPNSVFQYAPSFTWLKGINTFKFGADLRRYPDQLYDPQLLTVNTSKSFTGGPYANSVTSGTGNATAELLTGQATITSGYAPKVVFRHQYYAVYAEDTMKLTHKLAVTYGLRYSLEGSDVSQGDKLSYLDLTSPSPVAAAAGLPNLVGGVGIVGLNGASRDLQIPEKLHFEPRLGISYAPNDKTVIHAGAGIFYHPTASWSTNPPSMGYTRKSTSVDAQSNGYVPLFNLSNPYPSGLPKIYGNNPSPLAGNNTGSGPLSIELGQSIQGVLHKQSDAYQESWSLDVQRILPQHFVVTAAYVGSVGVHLEGAVQYNQLTDAQLATGSALTTTVTNPFYNIITDSSTVLSKPTVEAGLLERPHPQFENFEGYAVGWGHSSYEAGQLTVEHRMNAGLSLLVGYTYSKNIDNIGESPTTASIQDNGNLAAERSIADLDETHILRVSSVYELPIGPKKPFVNHGVLSYIAGGWEIGGTGQYNTGQPLQLTSPNQLASTLYTGGSSSTATMRPTLVPGQSITNTSGMPAKPGEIASFNSAAFVETGEFAFGNVPRYISAVRMPPYWDIDTLISKTTKISGRMSATFRAEALNTLNHPIFGAPDLGVTDTNFGYNTMTQANTPRYVQISGRFTF